MTFVINSCSWGREKYRSFKSSPSEVCPETSIGGRPVLHHPPLTALLLRNGQPRQQRRQHILRRRHRFTGVYTKPKSAFNFFQNPTQACFPEGGSTNPNTHPKSAQNGPNSCLAFWTGLTLDAPPLRATAAPTRLALGTLRTTQGLPGLELCPTRAQTRFIKVESANMTQQLPNMQKKTFLAKKK